MLLGNGLGFWKTMPMRRRNETASVPGVEISSPANRISPSIRAPVIRSFMRLKQRRSVLLPQPEGPMSAVILLRGMSIVMALRARAVPYQTERLRVVRTMDFSAPGGGARLEGAVTGATRGSVTLMSSSRLMPKEISGLLTDSVGTGCES